MFNFNENDLNKAIGICYLLRAKGKSSGSGFNDCIAGVEQFYPDLLMKIKQFDLHHEGNSTQVIEEAVAELPEDLRALIGSSRPEISYLKQLLSEQEVDLND